MYGGTGTFTQTGGSVGAYGNGSDQAIAIFVGGTNNIQGGRNSVTQDSGNGLYNMQGGLLVGGGETVGNYATGTFNQSGGTNCFVGNGDNNTNAYQSTIGMLQIGRTYTDGKGHYSYGQGTYNLSGTASSSGPLRRARAAPMSAPSTLATGARERSIKPAEPIVAPTSSTWEAAAKVSTTSARDYCP